MPRPLDRCRSLTRDVLDAVVNELALNAARCSREADEVAALTAHLKLRISTRENDSTPEPVGQPADWDDTGSIYDAAL